MNPPTQMQSIPVRASTVILVRDQKGPLEVYLLKRSDRSDFMPGSYVFPGGTVDSDDGDPGFWKTHVDINPAQIASRFGQDNPAFDLENALAYGIAAVRETFEEAGIFLARRLDGSGEAMTELGEQRSSHALPQGWLRKQVLSGKWAIALSTMAPWSHWITPAAQPRRYDTRFFIVVIPEGQACRPDCQETPHGLWTTPEAALAGNLKGTLPLSPPALVTLQELLPYTNAPSLKSEMSGRSWGEARVPRLIPAPGGAVLLLPWDPQYVNEAFLPDVDRLNVRQDLFRRPISRMWYSNGRWLPINP